MLLVVDDVLLLSALGGGATGDVGDAARRGDLYTTGSWYYRLGRAAHDWTFGGALSSALDVLPADRLDGLPLPSTHFRRRSGSSNCVGSYPSCDAFPADG